MYNLIDGIRIITIQTQVWNGDSNIYKLQVSLKRLTTENYQKLLKNTKINAIFTHPQTLMVDENIRIRNDSKTVYSSCNKEQDSVLSFQTGVILAWLWFLLRH